MGFFNLGTGKIPKESTEDKHGIIYVLGSLSMVFYFLLRFLPFSEADLTRTQMLQASQLMADALGIVGQCRLNRGIGIDEDADPNRTGLIGREFSSLTTTRGSLQAKRTTTNPNMAALVVYLLNEARLGEGDLVALGASGSFPALIISIHAAAKAMRLQLLPVYSVGASQWGANEPEFTWLHIEQCLRKADWLDVDPLAISLGGENDIGEGWGQEARSSIHSAIATSGAFLLHEPKLEPNVAARMKLYERRGPLSAFVNIGGAWANLGESPQVLELEPGLNEITKSPTKEQRGVLFEMADRGIPVIHFLFIRGLSERYGLPWDPAPLPAPGTGDVYQHARLGGPEFPLLCSFYLILMALIFTPRVRQALSRQPEDH